MSAYENAIKEVSAYVKAEFPSLTEKQIDKLVRAVIRRYFDLSAWNR